MHIALTTVLQIWTFVNVFNLVLAPDREILAPTPHIMPFPVATSAKRKLRKIHYVVGDRSRLKSQRRIVFQYQKRFEATF
ncbi:Hypothetical predicted protein [Octopus vulgaris]|uniref:Secreted protein n=1 Tax=Octopus vulgaris TaxID=6645 RepID=A0AA36F291_OCTVU|nr:Hypothetical predicted protein [Octopus vulgaris]